MERGEGGFRCGVVAVVGRPNVGKSTLLNRIVGEPVLIVSPHPQTTRHRISCIATFEHVQIVFLDTPGLNAPRDALHEFMQGQARLAFEDVDATLLVLDAGAGLRGGERAVIDLVRAAGSPVVVAVNKIDRVPRREVDRLLGELGGAPFWESLVPVSALRGDHVDELLRDLLPLLPEGPKLYPDDVVIDRSERFVIGELIREQVFLQTRDEVPHATAVLVEELEEREGGVLWLAASIYVERESQKAILIGKGGARMKGIGQAARERIERLLGTRVYLDLRVRVRKHWRKRRDILQDLGYEEPS